MPNALATLPMDRRSTCRFGLDGPSVKIWQSAAPIGSISCAWALTEFLHANFVLRVAAKMGLLGSGALTTMDEEQDNRNHDSVCIGCALYSAVCEEAEAHLFPQVAFVKPCDGAAWAKRMESQVMLTLSTISFSLTVHAREV